MGFNGNKKGKIVEISWEYRYDIRDNEIYPLVNIQKTHGQSPSSIGTSTINEPFSITISNYQRVETSIYNVQRGL